MFFPVSESVASVMFPVPLYALGLGFPTSISLIIASFCFRGGWLGGMVVRQVGMGWGEGPGAVAVARCDVNSTGHWRVMNNGVAPSVTSRPLGAARFFCAALPKFDITNTQLTLVFGSASRFTSVHDHVKGVYATLDWNRVIKSCIAGGLGISDNSLYPKFGKKKNTERVCYIWGLVH